MENASSASSSVRAMVKIITTEENSAMPITELNHFLLVAKDLERTKDFYCRVLGMVVDAERPDFGFPGYWLKANGDTCVHLASQQPNEIRDRFLLKKHPKGTAGSGAVDHIAFLARHAPEGDGGSRRRRPYRVPCAERPGGARPDSEKPGRDALPQLSRRQAAALPDLPQGSGRRDDRAQLSG